ncbi:CNNM domain-containing protein [Haloplanus pelagicus]|jgi:Mg2+/Co2+ transporter CorB|uniref:CNNM domain-containing protein n=1 Tax=Haloplanus pelagicus TaxID=2949995 RepID=UPI00203D2A15|nr:DUF21 domain-containing protein [Haloplanus sp. HW8-1]
MNVPNGMLSSSVVLLGLLAASAFFSSTEIAVFSLPEEWLADRVTAGDDRAAILADLREDPHRLLVTLLVGNNVVNVAISSVLAVLLASHFPEGVAVVLTTVVASSVVLVFGEILPKSYGLGNAKTWALRMARPIRIVERVLLPVVVVFDIVTRRAGAALGGDPDIEEPYTGTAAGGEGAK